MNTYHHQPPTNPIMPCHFIHTHPTFIYYLSLHDALPILAAGGEHLRVTVVEVGRPVPGAPIMTGGCLVDGDHGLPATLLVLVLVDALLAASQRRADRDERPHRSEEHT